MKQARGRALPLCQGPQNTWAYCLNCTGVTGPEHDQDQSMTTLWGRAMVLKFQDYSMTTSDWALISHSVVPDEVLGPDNDCLTGLVPTTLEMVKHSCNWCCISHFLVNKYFQHYMTLQLPFYYALFVWDISKLSGPKNLSGTTLQPVGAQSLAVMLWSWNFRTTARPCSVVVLWSWDTGIFWIFGPFALLYKTSSLFGAEVRIA